MEEKLDLLEARLHTDWEAHSIAERHARYGAVAAAVAPTKLVRVHEEDIDELLAHGQIIERGPSYRVIDGAPSQCHANAAEWWQSHRDLARPHRIATGYALSPDGRWHQHSWLVAPGLRGESIIETTQMRWAYWGIILDDEAAEQFAYENL
jgi:hypothetical protein